MILYFLARAFLMVIMKIKGVRVEGVENIPREGPVIIACNHISLWDPIIVGCAVRRQVCFMAKEELFNVSVLSFLLKKIGTFPVKRGKGDLSAIKNSLAVLKDGKVLGIFPEGTRSPSGDVQEAMSGIVFIMEKSKAPILPMKVYGTKGLLQQKRGNIGLIIGVPIYIDRVKIPEEIENRREWLANKIMNDISQL